MRKRALRAGLVSLAGAAAMAAVVAAVAPASAATVPVAFDCQARPPIGAPQQLALTTAIQAAAPASAVAGETFEVTLAADAMTVPAEASGYAVNNLRNLVLEVPVPAGASFASASLSGGSNLGSGTPTVSQADNVVTVRVPGPLAGGSTFQLPVLHLGLTATGAPGSSIDTRLAGTGYDDPGLVFTTNVRVGLFPVDVPTSCFANPAPTLTSTTVTEAAPTEEPAPTGEPAEPARSS